MACPRGEAKPNQKTKLRLFADSGGFCQNPKCLRPLFLDVGSTSIHIAEMAHVFAASNDGPRANPILTEAERGDYNNLILLCPSCHTIIDKAPAAHPDAAVLGWKENHKARIATTFGAVEYADRQSVRSAVEPLLDENRATFEHYGPNSDYRFNPESEVAAQWQRKVLSVILPNNRKLLAILSANRRHLEMPERETFELFKLHVDDLEARHLGGDDTELGGIMFPEAMNRILEPSYASST